METTSIQIFYDYKFKDLLIHSFRPNNDWRSDFNNSFLA